MRTEKIDKRNQLVNDSDLKFQNAVNKIQAGLDSQIEDYKRIYSESTDENKKMVELEIQDLLRKKEFLANLEKDSVVRKGTNANPLNWGRLDEGDSDEDYEKAIIKEMNDAFKQDLSATNKVRGVYEYNRKQAEFNPDYLPKDSVSTPAPEPTPTPQAQPQQAPSTRLTTDTTPAEFKPALMEKEKAKTEEEYLGKDRSKWANMSTADKVEGLAGLLGDAGGDIVDIVAAAHGIENGGAERLKKRRDEIKQRREERKKEYQEYLNRVDDINRQIAMHNNNTINNSAMAKFNADNAYRMINYQAQQQAAAQAKAGLYM